MTHREQGAGTGRVSNPPSLKHPIYTPGPILLGHCRMIIILLDYGTTPTTLEAPAVHHCALPLGAALIAHAASRGS